jgi:hypothetical protein
MKNDRTRLKSLLASGKCYRGGQYIDLFNQAVFDGFTGTIRARYDAGIFFVSTYAEQ